MPARWPTNQPDNGADDERMRTGMNSPCLSDPKASVTHGRQATFGRRISNDNQTPQTREERTGPSPIGVPVWRSGRETPYSAKSLAPDRPNQVDAVAAGYSATNGTSGAADGGANQRVAARYSRNRCFELPLSFRVFDKIQTVQPGAIVE
jgi:hypothetical protein